MGNNITGFEGKICMINPNKDVGLDPDARFFIGKKVKVLRQLKSGLFLVCLVDDETQAYAFAKYNIDQI
jgi:hypothetical protein